jgi:hypothetical protein
MITVRTTTASTDKHKTGVRFTIADERLNVLNEARDCIATYAKGQWASVFIDTENDTRYESKPFQAEDPAPLIPGMEFVGHNT